MKKAYIVTITTCAVLVAAMIFSFKLLNMSGTSDDRIYL